ncbi:MAG: hypothetical protein PSV16_00260 [Flavobacterium sp.]|nr:hypothetical protein [Flavobacterium sp.]
MKKTTYFLAFALLLLICQGASCGGNIQENQNTTRDAGGVVTSCDAGGELSMMSAPVVITKNENIICDDVFLSFKTAILFRDDAHSLATVCDDKLFAELYYSTDRSKLERLESLSSDGGEKIVLPSGVGRLVEKRALSAGTANADTRFYISPGNNYSPNRLEFKVQLPQFIGDFYARTVNFNASPLRNGQTIYYRWAKRIEKYAEGDPIKFSTTTYNVSFPTLNSVSAGPDKTITLPEERTVILDGAVVNNSGSIVSVEWKYVRHNFGPEIDPDITSPNTPITEIFFNDFGNHNFEITATDDCGRTFKDEVVVNVRGQLTSETISKCRIESNGSCGGDGSGRNMVLRNSSSDRFRVRIKLIRDLRSWQDHNTPGFGTIIEEFQDVTIEGSQTLPLGCSLLNGAALNGSDRAYLTWSIVSEQKL